MNKEILREHNFIEPKLCSCCSKPIPNQFSPFCNSCAVYNHRRQKEKENKLSTLRKIINNQQKTIIDLLNKARNKEEKEQDVEEKEEGNQLQSHDL